MDRSAISVLCLLLLAAFLRESYAGASKAQMKQALKIVRNICQPKCGATTAEIDGIAKGNFPPNNENLQEYCRCILDLLKLMKNDRFDPDAGLENLQKLPEDLREPLKEGVSKCRKADEGSKTGREAAYAVVKCMYNAIPDHFIFP